MSTLVAEAPRVSADRFLEDLATLARIGGREDGGVDRVAGSEADLAARSWLCDRVREFGGHAWCDGTGNVFGSARSDARPRLLIGSHSDTVPAGGQLDGAYGVVAAWEVLRTLVESAHPAAPLIQVVSFWDEEGVSPTSPGGLIGSTAFAAGDGVKDIRAFVELHIEQGSRMAESGWELAVVDAIVAIERHLLVFEGEFNHAGTTPMERRIDAGRVAAMVAVEVHDIACRFQGMVANVGSLELEPGAPNVIPGRAWMLTEFRCDRPEYISDAVEMLTGLARQTASGRACRVRHTLVSAKPAVRFDAELCRIAGQVLHATGRPTTRLASYARHDAAAVAAVRPAVMLFVPSIDGISHSPRERTPDYLLVQGVQALLDVVLEICKEWLS